MRSASTLINRVTSACALALVALVALCTMNACASNSHTYKINYDEQNAYIEPPSSAAAGEEVEVVCCVDVTDAKMVFYVDDDLVDYTYNEGGTKTITFTMPDHDVTVQYRIETDSFNGA